MATSRTTRRPSAYTAHHPDCPLEMGVETDRHCICGGRERPFYPRRVCVECMLTPRRCRCPRLSVQDEARESFTNRFAGDRSS